jgi:hypothetical protein
VPGSQAQIFTALPKLPPKHDTQRTAHAAPGRRKRQPRPGVEDGPTVARLIADVLEDEGFDVDVLLDGREALNRAVRESYN